MNRKKPLILFGGIFAALFFIFGVTGILAVVFYNGVVKAENRVDGSWAQVESALQRRLDLVPNLVSTVKGYAAHEKQVFLDVTRARTQAQAQMDNIKDTGPGTNTMASAAAAQGMLNHAFKKLLAVVENYPDLKAGSNFVALQDQLEGTENRINVARKRYNDAVQAYNSSIRTFPGNFISTLFGFSEHAYFKAEGDALKAPNVDFKS